MPKIQNQDIIYFTASFLNIPNSDIKPDTPISSLNFRKSTIQFLQTTFKVYLKPDILLKCNTMQDLINSINDAIEQQEASNVHYIYIMPKTTKAVIKVIHKELKIPTAFYIEEDAPISNLNLNKLTKKSLLTAIQEEFHVSLQQDIFPKCETVQDLADAIELAVEQQAVEQHTDL